MDAYSIVASAAEEGSLGIWEYTWHGLGRSSLGAGDNPISTSAILLSR